ncbi:hypothetical protein NPIL_352951 [Nephila pilipes]|uniref:Uncharacterized protein n=1 Tax=Nephila pilipes TaxID=299642 RepID=A0A8X6U3I2_NEPPI|nr:hypothetical protein NPIL_352951 [Nephila pilipes]
MHTLPGHLNWPPPRGKTMKLRESTRNSKIRGKMFQHLALQKVPKRVCRVTMDSFNLLNILPGWPKASPHPVASISGVAEQESSIMEEVDINS